MHFFNSAPKILASAILSSLSVFNAVRILLDFRCCAPYQGPLKKNSHFFFLLVPPTRDIPVVGAEKNVYYLNL
jgi:hypothetical protein